MGKVRRLPPRQRVKVADTWDLGSLYTSDAAWQRDWKKLKQRIGGFAAFQGRLGESPATLAACLRFDSDFDRLAERLGTYAFLKTSEDQANSTYQRMLGQYQHVTTRAAEAASYVRPEILALPADQIQELMAAPELVPYRLMLQRLLRYQPHTLSQREEALLAMQNDMAQAANRAFRQLLDADLKFGIIENEAGERVELSNATFSQLLISPSRNVRRAAFHQYYQQFQAHENTLAATLSGSIHKDIYYARARHYDSSLAAALFPDQVPHAVYDRLIAAVHRHLPALHRYYELRRRKMKLRDIHPYDTYVPILSELKTTYRWEQAAQLVLQALEPLGTNTVVCWSRGCGVAGAIAIRIRASRAAPSVAAPSTEIRTSSSTTSPLCSTMSSPWRTKPGTRCTATSRRGISHSSTTTTRFSWRRWPARSTKNC